MHFSNQPRAGVYGRSIETPGVIGESDRHIGVFGDSSNVGVYGRSPYFAGVFEGNILVTGAKSAVVPFPNGTRRVLYCMESPELWFEDFGTAKLKSGRALVKLDADFAKVIRSGDYRVFVTPEGDCRGLYVHRKRANTFEVRELGGGKSNIAFSYRIVGRRKDIKGRHRFAKIDSGLPVPPAVPRKSAPTVAGLRALVARVEKEAGERNAKRAKKTRGSRVLPRGSRPSIRPQLPRARARKK